jgi:hypothetical protein
LLKTLKTNYKNMHDHNNNNNEEGSHNGMMWMMLACCLLPILILFGGGAFLKSIGYGWVGIVLVGAFVIFHFRHMFGSHSNHNSDSNMVDDMHNTGQVKETPNKSNHKGGCCH